jgi:hypothetical protein
MRKLLFVSILMLATSAIAGPSIVGDMNGWNPSDPAMDLVLNANGIYELTLTGTPGTTWGYKVTETDAWDGNDFPGSNQSVTLIGTSVTFLVNLGATVGVKEGDEFVMHQNPIIAGNFLDQIGGANWDAADTTGEMSDNGDGTYSFAAALTQGTYDFKVTMNGNWDQDTVGGSSNHQHEVPCGAITGATLTFLYDMSTNTLTFADNCSVANEDANWGVLKQSYR